MEKYVCNGGKKRAMKKMGEFFKNWSFIQLTKPNMFY
jgi:hypothetical protein